MSRNHTTLKVIDAIGEEDAGLVKTASVLNCDTHRGQILDYYCVECKKVVCVSCFDENHKTHDCKDVATVEEEFRRMIKVSADKMSLLAVELLAKKEKSERKESFLMRIAKIEQDIALRSEELKTIMVDQHTTSLLSSLDEIKNRRLKEIQTEEEELERRLTILESFSRYCDALRSKGSASDICRSKDELLRRADELEEDHETYVMRSNTSFDVVFQATDLNNVLTVTDGNMIGILKEQRECSEDFAVLFGEAASRLYSYTMNLHDPNEVSPLVESAPTARQSFLAAAVYNNTMFITGFGGRISEVWKYNFASGWKKCGSLVEGRECHCAEFVDEMLYIFGGSVEKEVVLDSIEAYNALTEKSTVVGRLTYNTFNAACVAYKRLIYVFGGMSRNENVRPLDSVQMFNQVDGTCTLLSTTLPRPSGWLRVVSWDAYALLVSHDSCFIFDFESRTWQERSDQFKRGRVPNYFGMVIYNKRLFVVDDARCGNEDNVRYIRIASIVNNEVLNWRHWGQLPQPLYAMTTTQLSLTKQLD